MKILYVLIDVGMEKIVNVLRAGEVYWNGVGSDFGGV